MRHKRKSKYIPSIFKGKKLTTPFLAYTQLSKRGKLVVAVSVLSITVFIIQGQFAKSGFFAVPLIAAITDLMLFIIIRQDFKAGYTYPVLILPFFYSLAFGYFYFLLPVGVLFRIVLTVLYAFGLYSLFLCQNIFTIAATKTIALLSGARIVSFVLTLFTFYLIVNNIYSLHIFIIPTLLFVFLTSFFLSMASLWTFSLQNFTRIYYLWSLILAICVSEVAAALWFWPSTPTIISIFLTGFFYTILGLLHVWLEKRLFRSVIWEYIWVGFIILIILLSLTQWGK